MLNNNHIYCATVMLVSVLPLFAQRCIADNRPVQGIPTIRELEKRVLAGCRDSIRSGKVELIYQSLIGPDVDLKRKATVWFMDDSYRLDRTGRQPKMKEWGTVSHFILAEGRFFRDPQPDVLLNISPQSSEIADSIREKNGLLDPRYLGFVPGGVSWIAKYGYSMVIDRADRSEPVVTAEMLGDVKTYQVSFTTTNGITITSWYAADMAYRPIQIKGRSVLDGNVTEYVVKSEMKQFPQGSIWYPTTVDSTRSTNGKISEHDLVTVENAEFNISIDPTVFTVAGLNPKPGRRVVDGSSGKEEVKMWNGTSLVPVNPVTAVPVPTEPAKKVTTSRLFLLGNAAVLCVLGAIVFMRAVKK